jgi:GR25 family glycosyltransferase involved in LPS biosynthesis
MYAFYINLDRRTDRRAEFEEECRRMNLEVERFPAVERTPGGIGCCHSHIEVLRMARDRKYPFVFIFEDDFEFLVSRSEFDEIVSNLPDQYDVVMLSYNLQRQEPYNDRFGKVLEVQTTAGYIVSSRFYDTLLDTWERGVKLYEQHPECHWLFLLDQSWKALQPHSRWYYSLTRIGKQRAGWSDLGQRYVDYGQ